MKHCKLLVCLLSKPTNSLRVDCLLQESTYQLSLLSGSKGPEPDLLLVYGHVRSHLGFPAWRLRNTEIM